MVLFNLKSQLKAYFIRGLKLTLLRGLATGLMEIAATY
ncbi:hypothetical protein N481_22315 [Pseudoalteromonas luteoviolacea S4047-1]|uniref:Uncharacterized protein n=1 Tax=Pseudoalteromonas luteoviolacea S4054 TaxID=1129367 RepID=A0A0F6AE57_9GAMM|nr:hypothetical protein N479_08725 [Pseudoalteromonas luteoviolacea S4054]KZN69529.1 hypothetical protein N481_22315 [Pseudoalteromonas luteoviolacea S4047-1]